MAKDYGSPQLSVVGPVSHFGSSLRLGEEGVQHLAFEGDSAGVAEGGTPAGVADVDGHRCDRCRRTGTQQHQGVRKHDLLRHGAVGRLFGGVRAPSTLGTFLRSFTFGHVRQLDSVAASMLARLARATPLLPDADQVAFVDVDDTVRATHGYAKQGAGYGYSKVKGINVLLATASTPTAAPVIAAATRLRKGSANSSGRVGSGSPPWGRVACHAAGEGRAEHKRGRPTRCLAGP